MTLNDADAQNRFADLMRNQNGSTIQDFLNPVHDALFKFKNITADDQSELAALLDTNCGDRLFNEFVCKFFVNDLNAYALKSSIQNISDFPNITLISALKILSDVYEQTQNELIKGYILFLTFDITDFIAFALEDYDKTKLEANLFHIFVIEEALPKYIKHKLCINPSQTHGFCLLSFFCQNDDTNKAVIPALLKYGNVVIDWERCNSLNSVFAQLINNYEQLNEPATTKGFDVNGSFENAVKLFTFVAPNWDNLSATFLLRNKPLPSGSSFSLGGGSRVSDSDLVKIFAGQYGLVPLTQPQANSTNLDVIADFNAYNQLSQRRKLQVAHFLINNRKRFNDVLGESAQLVINGLQTKLNSSTISGAFRSFTPTYARSVGFSNDGDDDIANEARSFVQKLSKQYENAEIKTFDQAIGFIVHNYIPMLRQFQNRCNETYGMATARSALAKYATDRTLNVVGVASQIPSINYTAPVANPVISGGARKAAANPPTPVAAAPVAVAPAIENNDMPLISGASSSTDLVNAFIEGQKEFNKSYESIYRKLISALNAVNISNVHQQSFTKLYSVCNQFDSIAIKNAKTTAFLSGYYGAKNYNRLYTKCVENTIHSIEAAGVSGFDGCLNVLKQLKDLMTSTAAKVQSLRNKYINASKSVSEMLIVAAHKIKQPCQLTQKDFNNLTEAVNRIYNTIKNYTSETSTYNTKQQLESYIGKIEDRAKVISEHYELLVQGLRIKYQAFPNTSREREYAKEAQTTIFNQIRDIMLYLNKTFDVKLAKERIDHLHQVNLTQAQIENIEKAFLAFRNIRVTNEFKEQMEKLNRALDPISVGSVFKIVKKLRKLIVKSQYLQFISQLYKELGIFSENFNWDEFIEKYTSLVVLSSIQIEPIYKVGSERYTLEGIAHKAATEFEDFCTVGDSKLLLENNQIVHNAAYSFILDYLRRALVTSAPKGIAEFKIINNLFGDPAIFDTYIKGDTSKSDFNFFKDCKGYEITKDQFNSDQAKFNTKVENVDGKIVSKSNAPQSFVDCIGENCIVGDNTSIRGRQAANVANSVISVYKDISTKQKPFFYSHLPALIVELHRALGDNNCGFKKFVDSPLARADFWGVSICQGTSELPIAEYSIDALFANIIAVVDKYWSVKYSGSLPLPLNINMVLRGGNVDGEDIEKQEGGSIFDSMPLHDQSYSTIIPEAVPFYICALHICQYYINTFSIKRIDTDDQNLQLVLSINKISSLYPIYEIFNKYQATITSLTPQQLKICLSVFNEYWNQTQGNEAARLSRAIDLVFNELNACFIFTDKLQYELMKSTNSLSKISVDVINDKLSYLVETMKERLNDSILEVHEDPALQSKRLEGLLNTAFQETKRAPESQRLSVLKNLLSQRDEGGELRDFYAFMETVVSPLLICAKSYIYIFSLFDNYEFEGDYDQDPQMTRTKGVWGSINLANLKINWFDTKDGKDKTESVWDIIQSIRNNTRPDLKVLFIENPIVVKYNRILLNAAYENLHATGKFVFPNFWVVLDEHTYPRSPSLSLQFKEKFNRIDTIPLLRQIYPTVQAANVADYFNHCVSEFTADYDHFIHAFLSYPGLSDKTIKLIANKAHDAFKIFNEPIKDDNGRQTGVVYSIKPHGGSDQKLEILNAARPLYNIRVERSKHFIVPPPPANHTIIPRFADPAANIEELEITSGNKFNAPGYVQLDGTGLYIRSEGAKQDNINTCEYSWLDWVVYHVGRCNKLDFCLPYKFLQMLRDTPSLSLSLRLPGTGKISGNAYQKYNRSATGVFSNIVTQNIILRSNSAINKEKAELSALNPSWTASLVSVVPYLISTLTANKLSMDTSVTYNGQSVNQQLTQLIDILTSFYDEISNFAPFIPFMSNSVGINQTRVKPHLFAELLALVSNEDICSLESNDFIKLEWANQYFYNYIDNIAFPEYKSRDRFEWIKQFAADKINNGAFKSELDSSIQALGRIVWAGLIAKSTDYVVEYHNTYRKLDTTITKVINIMSECDTGIINQFIQNIIAEYNDYYVNSQRHGAMAGGAITFENVYSGDNAYDPDTLDLIKRLTRGLFQSVQQVKKSSIEAYKSALNDRFSGKKGNVDTGFKDKLVQSDLIDLTETPPKQEPIIEIPIQSTVDGTVDQKPIDTHEEDTFVKQDQPISDVPTNAADLEDVTGVKLDDDTPSPQEVTPSVEPVVEAQPVETVAEAQPVETVAEAPVSEQKKLSRAEAKLIAKRAKLDQKMDEIVNGNRGAIDNLQKSLNLSNFVFGCRDIDTQNSLHHAVPINGNIDEISNNLKGKEKSLKELISTFKGIRRQFADKADELKNLIAKTNPGGAHGRIMALWYQNQFDIGKTKVGEIYQLLRNQFLALTTNYLGNYKNDVSQIQPATMTEKVLADPSYNDISNKIQNKYGISDTFRSMGCAEPIKRLLSNNGDANIPFSNGLVVVKQLNIPKELESCSNILKYYHALAASVLFSNIIPFSFLLDRIDGSQFYPGEEDENGDFYSADKALVKIGLQFMAMGPIAQLQKLNNAAQKLATDASDPGVRLIDYLSEALSICTNTILTSGYHDDDEIFINFFPLLIQGCGPLTGIVKLWEPKHAYPWYKGKILSDPKKIRINLLYIVLNMIPNLLLLQQLYINNDYINGFVEAAEALYTFFREDVFKEADKLNGLQGKAQSEELQFPGALAQLVYKIADNMSKTPIGKFYNANNLCYLTTAVASTNFQGGRGTGRFYIAGGAGDFTDEKENAILQIAAGIAQEVRNRAVYYDLSQSFASCPVLVNPADNSQNPEVTVNVNGYYYKFLYNPNLCVLFNKSGFNPRDFITYILARNQEFVINPFSPASDFVVDWSKVNLVINRNHKNKLGIDASTIGQLFNGGVPSVGGSIKQDESARLKSWVKNVLSAPEAEVEINDLGNRSTAAVKAAPFFNTGSSRRPIAHNVKLSDDMFLLAPGNAFIIRQILSPQKDIFNATIYSSDDVAVPTFLNFNAFQDGVYNFKQQVGLMADNKLADNKHYPADYQFKPGSILYANANKLSSNFKNFSFNPIYRFIQSLLEENINSVFRDDVSLGFNNFGFDVGSTKKLEQSFIISGGFNISENFSDELVNIDTNLDGNKEVELLSNAYNLDNSAKTQKTFCKAKLLYSYVFKNNLGASSANNNETMFHLIMNYFHKYNISFNSMFNQLCFPSVLFNSAGLRLSIKRVKELVSAIDERGIEGDKNRSYKARVFDFVKFYLGAYVDNNGNSALDLCKDYKYQVGFGEANREEVDLIDNVKTRIEANKKKLNASSDTLAIGNQYIAPSIANNFMVEITKYVAINKQNPINHCEKLQSLFGSGVLEALRHLDSLSTYVSVLFMLLKQTSYYSHEYDRDLTYFNVEAPEVFSVV